MNRPTAFPATTSHQPALVEVEDEPFRSHGPSAQTFGDRRTRTTMKPTRGPRQWRWDAPTQSWAAFAQSAGHSHRRQHLNPTLGFADTERAMNSALIEPPERPQLKFMLILLSVAEEPRRIHGRWLGVLPLLRQ